MQQNQVQFSTSKRNVNVIIMIFIYCFHQLLCPESGHGLVPNRIAIVCVSVSVSRGGGGGGVN